MAFDTDGIGRTYLQLKSAGNSFSLSGKYFFPLELRRGKRTENRFVCSLQSEKPLFFKACDLFFPHVKTNKILHTLKISVESCKTIKRKKCIWNLENLLENWYLFWFILQILFLILWRYLNEFVSSVWKMEGELFYTSFNFHLSGYRLCTEGNYFFFLCDAKRN